MSKSKVRKASSVQQRKLLGYAYACATGKSKNCPDSIMNISKSFTKKNKKKGLKNLRSFARTKHTGLPLYAESIIKFNDFFMANENKYVIDYLYSLKNPDINGYVNDFLSCSNNEKEGYIEDILLEVGDIVNDEKYIWISTELKKEIIKKK